LGAPTAPEAGSKRPNPLPNASFAGSWSDCGVLSESARHPDAQQGKPVKRTVVNRLIRIAISKRTRLIREAKQRMLTASALGTQLPVARGLDGLDRQP